MLELKTGVTIAKCCRPLEKFRYDFDLWKIDEFSHLCSSHELANFTLSFIINVLFFAREFVA